MLCPTRGELDRIHDVFVESDVCAECASMRVLSVNAKLVVSRLDEDGVDEKMEECGI